MRGTVQSLGADGASISIALEKRHGDPATAKLFGRVLRVDRVRELADGVTYEVSRLGQISCGRLRVVEFWYNVFRLLDEEVTSALAIGVLFRRICAVLVESGCTR